MILCCGEALVEMQPLPAGDGPPRFAAHPGGTAVGCAVALGRLGVPVGFFGALSTDRFGRLLAHALTEARVDLSRAPRSDRPTTLAFPDPGGGVDLRDGATAGRMLEAGALPALSGVAALAFGGVHLAAEPCGSAFEALATAARSRHVLLLDPNIRPALIADADAYRARLDRMIALSDILKLSEADLAWLRGSGETDGQGEALLALGPSLVIVTHGARGATAHAAGRAPVFVPAPSVTVADRLGAGETFTAGILAALHRAGALDRASVAALPTAALRRAVNLGVHAAAVTVSRRGPNPPYAGELS